MGRSNIFGDGLKIWSERLILAMRGKEESVIDNFYSKSLESNTSAKCYNYRKILDIMSEVTFTSPGEVTLSQEMDDIPLSLNVLH